MNKSRHGDLPHSANTKFKELPQLINPPTNQLENGDYRYGEMAVIVRRPNVLLIDRKAYESELPKWQQVAETSEGPGPDAVS